MTADNKNGDEWETDTTRLLARLPPLLPGSGGYELKPHPPALYIPGYQAVDPEKFEKDKKKKQTLHPGTTK